MSEKKRGAILRDWPGVITIVLIGAVGIHGLAGKYAGAPWLLKQYITDTGDFMLDPSGVSAVYLGLSAVAAISAGFAGVIIVFGLTSESTVFRNFRQDSGDRLSANWTSVIASAFLSSALSLGAALFQLIDRPFVANIFFELGCLLLLHSAIRSVWVMRLLLNLVGIEDNRRAAAEKTARHGDLFSAIVA
jgi:hypothetical protein